MFDLSSNLPPYCYGNLDQTNCTDVYKVGGHCLINGYMSNVSKYVVYDSPLVENPANLCDDNLDSECILPSEYTSCVVHKHKLCDGIIVTVRIAVMRLLTYANLQRWATSIVSVVLILIEIWKFLSVGYRITNLLP